METRVTTGGEANVHVFYANVTNNFDIYPLELNKSGRFSKVCKNAYCSLSDFEESLKDHLMVPDELEKRCTSG